jgi:glycerol kinase
MTERYILALDQGTTSSRALLFDREGRPVGQLNQEFPQLYPQPGWVEHEPLAIWESQLAVTRALLAQLQVSPEQIAAIGIANQRETTLIWDAQTGQPIHNAIVWQCRRTAPLCDELRAAGWAEPIRQKTGLVLDAYFSGTKVKWILDHVPGARERATRGELRFGTVDTWLIWNLTGGRVHVTDYSNASRTLLFNIHTLDWDEEILAALDIPRAILPEVRPSSAIYGETDPSLLGAPIPISGCAGDQQAALFGQGCFEPGEAKNTYGTGCFMLMQTGEKAVASSHGLLTTIAWGLNGKVEYALEGSIFVAGAAIQWLRDELRIIDRADQTEALARSIPDTGGVYLVPAFVGLGAPYWDPYARGTLVGLTRGSGRAQIARAALESIAYQTRDLLDAMQADSGIQLQALKVDGGAVRNDFLMQFQADMIGTRVDRPVVNETTALGAAYLAGLAVGFWSDQAELRAKWQRERSFQPAMEPAERAKRYRGWQRAVERSRAWAEEGNWYM